MAGKVAVVVVVDDVLNVVDEVVVVVVITHSFNNGKFGPEDPSQILSFKSESFNQASMK